MNSLPNADPPARQPPVWKRVADMILTSDRKQSRRLVLVLMTAVVYTICAGLLLHGARSGLFDPLARIVALLCMANAALFVLVIRSGINLHFALPSLALPQAISAQTLIAMSYAVIGQTHPSTLALLAMVMVFGMFEMNTKRVWVLLSYTIVLMAVTIGWCVTTKPDTYPMRIELIHFVVMAVVLISISALSVQLGNMRRRVRRQKVELEGALEHIRLVATHDDLTGLPNRRHMIALLAEHAARQARGGPPFSVALADIDHFKSVNDRFGHRIGDDALKCFAQQARLHLRNTDIAGRWGGEEFLLVLPASPPGDPNIGIERLRGALAVAQASPGAPHLRIAFSTGLTKYVAGESIDDLVERADKALYLAKSEGRNQTRVIYADEVAGAAVEQPRSEEASATADDRM